MPLTTYTAGEVLTAASLNANFTFAAANPVSKIAQVISVFKADAFSTASTSFVDVTDLTVSITPTLDTSKVLIMAYVSTSASTSNDHFLNLNRGSTAICQTTSGNQCGHYLIGGSSR
jgi:3-deoxy-D-arabino-heptulosonate 7-phosphate (DAHP) synthase